MPEKQPDKKGDWKKALLIGVLAGPKASLLFGGVMLKKVLASYGIILTKGMMAMFSFNFMVSVAVLILYKKNKKLVNYDVPMP